MRIQHFHDQRTGTLTYVVADEESKVAVVIDPVMDFDPNSGRIYFESAESVAQYIDENGYSVPYVLDTHTHADHLTAMPFFRTRYGAQSVIGSDVPTVQATFKTFFNLDDGLATDGSQFDILLEDYAKLDVGPFEIEAIPTGGHTPASMSYRIQDAVFVGDSLFQPDSGTARCDFPGASAGDLYDSIQRIFALPDDTRVFTSHDYQPGDRELAFESTVGAQRRENIHVHDDISRADFVALRTKLEVGKPAPTLLFAAVQVNIRAGNLPDPEANGVSYLKIPLNTFGTEASR